MRFIRNCLTMSIETVLDPQREASLVKSSAQFCNISGGHVGTNSPMKWQKNRCKSFVERLLSVVVTATRRKTAANV